MATVKALHRIQRRIKGETQVVAPGTEFALDGDELKEMKAAGAVIEVAAKAEAKDETESKPARKPAAKKTASKPAAKSGDEELL